MKVPNGHIELEADITGADYAPPVVLLHGILGVCRTWDWIVPRLAVDHRVIRLDFRGHGRSDRAADNYQLADYLSDAVAVCRDVAARPAVVIGYSIGAITAAALAQLHPELVSGAVFEEAPLGRLSVGTDLDPAPPALVEEFTLLRQEIPRMQGDGATHDDVVALIAGMPSASGAPLGDVLHADGVAGLAAGMLAVDVTVLDPVLDASLKPVFDIDGSIAPPFVAVAADPAMPDHATEPDDLVRIMAANPHGATRTVAGAGHLLHDTVGAREEFWGVVEAFVSDLSGR